MKLDKHLEQPYSPFKENVLFETVSLHSGYMSFHFWSIRVTDWYIDMSDGAIFLKDSFENVLTRFYIFVVLMMTRSKPFDRKVNEMNCVGSFTSFHLVHVGGITEEWIPIVTGRKVVLSFTCLEFYRFWEAWQFYWSAIELRNDVPQLTTRF